LQTIKRRSKMPKVVYSASKGLYQESGSGFAVGDVAVTEAAESVANADTDGNLAAYGSSTLTGDGAVAMTLPDGSAVGAMKFITCDSVASGDPLVTVTSGIKNNGTDVLASLEFDAANEHALLIWDGNNWLCVSKTATEG
jgi:hypothetical protein